MKRIAVFVSGSGSNAENLVKYFRRSNHARVSIMLCNNKNAYALERARSLGIPSLTFDKEDFYANGKILLTLQEQQVDLIVLAGFLWLVPQNIIDHYKGRIVNIHPALLPKFGGKGMFGMHVHEAVIAANEKESGITIHYVNGNYDEGNTIFQAKVQILPADTPADLAAKIHELEYRYFPIEIEKLIVRM